MDLEVYLDVVPWLLFVVIDRTSGLGLSWAAGSAMACGAGIVAWSHRRGRRVPIGWIAVGIFGAVMVVGLGASSHASWFEPTVRSGSVLLLAVIAFASLLGQPLSVPYSADRVSPSRRSDKAFVRVNRQITIAWGLAALTVAISFACDAFSPTAVVRTLCDWVVPLVVVSSAVRWVAVTWSTYLDRADGLSATALADVSLGSLGADGESVSPGGTSLGSITYLPRARTGR